jgi:hypothetical protein
MEAGRPTKYEVKMNRQAYLLCLRGCIDKELAEFLEINTDTLNEWKKKYPKFKAAIQKGKADADNKVAESLFKSAMGISYTESSIEESEDGMVKRETKKFVPPNITAIKFWLINRDKQNWRDKQEVEVTNKTIIVEAPPEEDADDE